jgi:hypothetical protein
MNLTSLEKLITSLNKGESRVFSTKTKSKNQPIYFKIFKQVKNKGTLGEYKSSKYTQYRKYLFDTLLLSISQNTGSLDSRILKKLINTEMLFKRHMIEESWKESHKALYLAKKHERYGFLIQIYEWKKDIGLYLDNFSQEDYFDLSQKEEDVLQKQLSFLKIKKLYMEILSVKREYGYLTVDYNRERFHKFNVNINETETDSKRILFYSRMTKAIYHWMLKEHDCEYELTKKNTLEVDINVDYSEYMIAHLEHLTSCICNASFNELLSTLNNLRKKEKNCFFGDNPNIRLKLFIYAANYEIMTFVYLNDTESLTAKLEEVEQGLISWQKNLSKDMFLMISTAQRLGYYYIGNYKKARHFTNLVLNGSSKLIRKDVYNGALLFNLTLVFDKSDTEYQESVLKKTIRHLKNNNKENSFEYLFATTLLKNHSLPMKFNKTFESLKPHLGNYYFKLSDGRLYSENYLHAYIWLISKLKRINAKKVMEKWHNNQLETI